MMNRIREFLRSEDGPTATEYAVMLALIVLAAIGAMTALGGKVNTIFTDVEAAI